MKTSVFALALVVASGSVGADSSFWGGVDYSFYSGSNPSGTAYGTKAPSESAYGISFGGKPFSFLELDARTEFGRVTSGFSPVAFNEKNRVLPFTPMPTDYKGEQAQTFSLVTNGVPERLSYRYGRKELNPIHTVYKNELQGNPALLLATRRKNVNFNSNRVEVGATPSYQFGWYGIGVYSRVAFGQNWVGDGVEYAYTSVEPGFTWRVSNSNSKINVGYKYETPLNGSVKATINSAVLGGEFALTKNDSVTGRVEIAQGDLDYNLFRVGYVRHF